MDQQFLLERIAATKLQIVAQEEAMLNLSSGAISSYTIDTGQTKQTVTKSNISTLSSSLDSLYNRLVTLQARAGCGGVVYVTPAF